MLSPGRFQPSPTCLPFILRDKEKIPAMAKLEDEGNAA
jgi:hypothetical protein